MTESEDISFIITIFDIFKKVKKKLQYANYKQGRYLQKKNTCLMNNTLDEIKCRRKE